MYGRLFVSGKFLAVVGDDHKYWLCKCRQHVYEDKTDYFWVQWLEKEVDLYKYPVKTTYLKRNSSSLEVSCQNIIAAQ